MKRDLNALGRCVVIVCSSLATTALSQAGSLSAGSSAGGLSVRAAVKLPAGPVTAAAGSAVAPKDAQRPAARITFRSRMLTLRAPSTYCFVVRAGKSLRPLLLAGAPPHERDERDADQHADRRRGRVDPP